MCVCFLILKERLQISDKPLLKERRIKITGFQGKSTKITFLSSPDCTIGFWMCVTWIVSEEMILLKRAFPSEQLPVWCLEPLSWQHKEENHLRTAVNAFQCVSLYRHLQSLMPLQYVDAYASNLYPSVWCTVFQVLIKYLDEFGQIFACFHVVPDMYIYIKGTEEIAYLVHSDMFLNLLKFPFAWIMTTIKCLM